MKYLVSIDNEVCQSLRTIAAWYEERSQSSEVAKRWLHGFDEALQSLEEEPGRFPLARESRWFSYELRELLYGSGRRKTHRALFRIVGDRVEVLAIRHLAQRDVTPDDW